MGLSPLGRGENRGPGSERGGVAAGGEGWDPLRDCVVLSPVLSAAGPEFQKGRGCLSFLPLNSCDPPGGLAPVPPTALLGSSVHCPLLSAELSW